MTETAACQKRARPANNYCRGKKSDENGFDCHGSVVDFAGFGRVCTGRQFERPMAMRRTLLWPAREPRFHYPIWPGSERPQRRRSAVTRLDRLSWPYLDRKCPSRRNLFAGRPDSAVREWNRMAAGARASATSASTPEPWVSAARRSLSAFRHEATRLARPKLGVQPSAEQQLLMGALFEDLAVIEHDQPIHGGNGREPMRNRNHGLARHEVQELLLDRGFGF